MTHPKIQHYVPQFLLKGFTRGKKGQLFVFDKECERVFKSKPSQIAAENAFYDFDMNGETYSMEPSLSLMESRMAHVVKKIRCEESLTNLTEEEFVLVAYFIAVQYIRVSNFRQNLKQLNEQVGNKLESMGIDLNELSDFKIFTEEEIKRDSNLMILHIAPKIIPYVVDKMWILLKTKQSNPFIISDNPIALDNRKEFKPYGNRGFGVPGIEIYLPISDVLCLYLVCTSYEKDIIENREKVLEFKEKGIDNAKFDLAVDIYDSAMNGSALTCHKEMVLRHNSLQVANANRWIYSPVDDFNLAKVMLQENVSFKKGPYPKVF